MKIILLTLCVLLVGCSVNVRDYDAEKMEFDQIGKIKKAQSDPFNNPPTPDYVRVAEDSGVLIEAIKLKPITGHQNIKLDVWAINAINSNDIPKCVAINWKLQDFELESGLPFEFLINAYDTVKVGRMKQTIWSFDNTAIALPPSGYVDSMRVKDAKMEDTLGKYTCDELEKDIQEPKEERN